MKKDSILQNFYYSKLPKAQTGFIANNNAVNKSQKAKTFIDPRISAIQNTLDLVNLARQVQSNQTPQQKAKSKKLAKDVKKYIESTPESVINPNFNFDFYSNLNIPSFNTGLDYVGSDPSSRIRSTQLFNDQLEKTRELKEQQARFDNLQFIQEAYPDTPESERRRKELNNQKAASDPDNYRIDDQGNLVIKSMATKDEWNNAFAIQTPEFVETAAFATPSGRDFDAGQTGAHFFVNTMPFTAPITSTGRLTQFAMGQNPYGFNSNGVVSNILPTLFAAGDIAGIGSIKMLPGGKNLASRTGRFLTEQTPLKNTWKLNPYAGKVPFLEGNPNWLKGWPKDYSNPTKIDFSGMSKFSGGLKKGTKEYKQFEKLNKWWASVPQEEKIASESLRKFYWDQGNRLMYQGQLRKTGLSELFDIDNMYTPGAYSEFVAPLKHTPNIVFKFGREPFVGQTSDLVLNNQLFKLSDPHIGLPFHSQQIGYKVASLMPKVLGEGTSFGIVNKPQFEIPRAAAADMAWKLRRLNQLGIHADWKGNNFMFDPNTSKLSVFDLNTTPFNYTVEGFGQRFATGTNLMGENPATIMKQNWNLSAKPPRSITLKNIPEEIGGYTGPESEITTADYQRYIIEQQLKKDLGDILRTEGVPDPRSGGAYKAPTDKLTWKDPYTGETVYELEAADYNDFKTPKDYKDAQKDMFIYKRNYLQKLIDQRNANLASARLLGEYGKQPKITSLKGFNLDKKTQNLLGQVGEARFTDVPMYYTDFLGKRFNVLSGLEINDFRPLGRDAIRNKKSEYFMITPNKYGGSTYANGGMIEDPPTDERSQEFYNKLKSYYTAPERTEKEKAEYAAFLKFNEKHGYAPVALKSKTISGNPMINPFTGRLNLLDQNAINVVTGQPVDNTKFLLDTYMSEYPHYMQYNSHPNQSKFRKSLRFIGKWAKDFGNMLKNTKGLNFEDAYFQNYATPGTVEHDAHGVIEPNIRKEFDEYTQEYLTNSKSKGGWLDRKYGPGGQTTDGCGPGYSKNPLTGECLPNGWTPSGHTSLAGVTNQSKTSTSTPSYGSSLESVGTGVTSLQRKPELEQKINAKKSIDKQIQNQGEIKVAEPEEGVLSRAWNIISNPMTALSYKIKGQDIPLHFERGDKNILDLPVNLVNPATYINSGASLLNAYLHPIETSTTLGKAGTNLISNLVDNQNVFNDESNSKALELLGDAGNMLLLGESGALKSLNNALVKSTESGVLSNAHRINPLAGTFAGESKLPSWLQLNKLDDANAYWRLTRDPIEKGIYEGSYFNKGVPLTGDLANTFEYGSRPWMHRYSGLIYNPETGQMNRYFGPDYLFKVTDPSKMEPFLKFPEPHLRFFRSTEAMSPNSPGVTQFKKDWLQGWKEVPKQRKGGMIEDNRGQWAHPGKNTRIRSPHITMKGVPYPVLAKANNGMSTLMQPGQDYYFPGADYVDEFPKKAKKGLNVTADKCPDGQVKVNGVCVDINSDTYRKAYAQKLTGFGTADDPNYITPDRIQTLPGVTVQAKKPGITNYVFVEDDEDGAFRKEAENLKYFKNKNNPEEKVVIISGYGQKYFDDKVRPTLANIKESDNVFVFGHHGDMYAGVPNSLWGNVLEQAQRKSGNFNCYLGSCGSSDLVGAVDNQEYWNNQDPAFSRLNNFYYRPMSKTGADGWLGVNPNATKVEGNSHASTLNAMFTRSQHNPMGTRYWEDLNNYRQAFIEKRKTPEITQLEKESEALYNSGVGYENNHAEQTLRSIYEEINNELDSDPKYIALRKRVKNSEKPYIVKEPRYGLDYSRNDFNPYINIDKREKAPKEINMFPFVPSNRQYGGLIKAQYGVEVTPSPEYYETVPYNLDYYNSFVPEYRRTYGPPMDKQGDTYDEMYQSLKSRGFGQKAANIMSFLNKYYDVTGNLKRRPLFSIDPYNLPIDKNAKLIDDPEEEKRRIEKHRQIQGVMGVDYYKDGGSVREKAIYPTGTKQPLSLNAVIAQNRTDRDNNSYSGGISKFAAGGQANRFYYNKGYGVPRFPMGGGYQSPYTNTYGQYMDPFGGPGHGMPLAPQPQSPQTPTWSQMTIGNPKATSQQPAANTNPPKNDFFSQQTPVKESRDDKATIFGSIAGAAIATGGMIASVDKAFRKKTKDDPCGEGTYWDEKTKKCLPKSQTEKKPEEQVVQQQQDNFQLGKSVGQAMNNDQGLAWNYNPNMQATQIQNPTNAPSYGPSLNTNVNNASSTARYGGNIYLPKAQTGRGVKNMYQEMEDVANTKQKCGLNDNDKQACKESKALAKEPNAVEVPIWDDITNPQGLRGYPDPKSSKKKERDAFSDNLTNQYNLALSKYPNLTMPEYIAALRDSQRYSGEWAHEEARKFFDPKTGALLVGKDPRNYSPYQKFYQSKYPGQYSITPDQVLDVWKNMPGGFSNYPKYANIGYVTPIERYGGDIFRSRSKSRKYSKFAEGGLTGPEDPYHPLTNPTGYRDKNVLERLKKLPNKEKEYDYEKKLMTAINPYLTSQLKLAKNRNIKRGGHNGPLDAIRHAGSSAALATEVFPSWLPFHLKIIGANALGAAHEFTSRGDIKWKETGSDLYNNFIGSIIGSLPISKYKKQQMVIDAQNKGILSDLKDNNRNIEDKANGGDVSIPQLPIKNSPLLQFYYNNI